MNNQIEITQGTKTYKIEETKEGTFAICLHENEAYVGDISTNESLPKLQAELLENYGETIYENGYYKLYKTDHFWARFDKLVDFGNVMICNEYWNEAGQKFTRTN